METKTLNEATAKTIADLLKINLFLSDENYTSAYLVILANLEDSKANQLLENAVEFNVGPPVHINGKLAEDCVDLGLHHHYMLSHRGENAWAIVSGPMVLSRATDEFEYEPLPSSRTDEFKAATRFTTPEEALEFLEGWRIRERQKYDEWKAGKRQYL